MSELKPSIREAFCIGEQSGFVYIDEAIHHYLSHYDLFFLIEKYQEQYEEFRQELKDNGFLQEDNTLINMTIKDALTKLQLDF